MNGLREVLKPIVERVAPGWKFSSIEGDIVLGDGIKCYATRLTNSRKPIDDVLKELHETADNLVNAGAEVMRRKTELVIYDDRSSKITPCKGGCVECHLDDLKSE